MMKYHITCKPIKANQKDIASWREYQLNTMGDNLHELVLNARITEINIHNEEITSYPLYQAPFRIEKKAYIAIGEYLTYKGDTDEILKAYT